MDPEVVRALRAAHREAKHAAYCWRCDVPWPCPTIALLADWERRGEKLQRIIEEERSLILNGRPSPSYVSQSLHFAETALSPEPERPRIARQDVALPAYREDESEYEDCPPGCFHLEPEKEES